MKIDDGYPLPASRPLRVYAFDPSAGRKLNNYMTIPVAYEKLEPGPVGARLAVIDYDASNEIFYQAVNLDHPSVLIANGLEPSESDPRFHQQMVYAIASETIRRFEYALGRHIRWRTKKGSLKTDAFHARLRIFPHLSNRPTRSMTRSFAPFCSDILPRRRRRPARHSPARPSSRASPTISSLMK